MSKAKEILKDVQEKVLDPRGVLRAIENGIRNWKEIKEYGVSGSEMWLEMKDGSRFTILVSKATK